MRTILSTFSELKLEQPMHRARFFNYMCDKNIFAYTEASFFLCARDYIFHPDDSKIAAFTSVFLRKGSRLEVNISSQHYAAAFRFFNGREINIDSYENKGLTRKARTFRNSLSGGLRQSGAGNYNIVIQALDFIARSMSRDKTNQAIQKIRAEGSMPISFPDREYMNDVTEELSRVWGNDPLKQLT